MLTEVQATAVAELLNGPHARPETYRSLAQNDAHGC